MTNTPLVSVIMPCYNSERFIAESIDSVIGQSYPNFELLITDDGSTDNSVEIIKNKVEKDNRIKLFILKERKGIAKARNNTGYAQVFGKYNTTSYDKLKLDMVYVENCSILLDIKLILLTLKVIFIKESTEGLEEGQTTAMKK